jgi:type I restriction enzyme S subunit
VSEWREKPLGQVARLSWGDTSTTKASYAPSGWPAYSASGRDGFLPHFDHEEDAVVISAIGALCGKTWLARGRWSCIKNTMWMRALPGEADNRFLYHATRRSDFWPRRGAAQPFISLGDARSTLVELPPVGTQRRIAAVLSAFDELIEINERRIEVLEDLARSLYREWFLCFRFPGHAEVDFVDSQLGPIPDEWRVEPTQEVLRPVGGGTPSKKRSDYWEGGQIAWFTPSDLTKSGIRYLADSGSRITTLGLAKSGARLFPAGSVLMTSRATLGVLGITTTDATCNQGFIVIPPVEGIPAEFIYEWLATQKDQLESIATGATFKEITKTAFARFPFLLPTREALARFKDRIAPIGDQLGLCEGHIRALTATRDLLLPRLVTGRLDISDIDLGELLPAAAA